MAVLAISLDQKGRHFLSMTLLILNLTLALISFITTIIGISVAALFHQQRDVFKDFSYSGLNAFVILSSLVLTAFHLFGAKLSFNLSNTLTTDRSKKFMVTFFGLLFIAEGILIILSITTSAIIYQLSKGYEKGFKELMEAYDTDKTKRMEINLLQLRNKCCGSTGYKDWMEISWYPDEFMRPELRGRKERGVPFTCCNPEYMGPCLHDAGDKARPGYKKPDATQFYSDGCAEVVTANLRWLLSNLSLWLILPIWLEIFLMIGTKYLLTSITNAAEAGDEEGPGYGYLMKKCPCSCLQFLECEITPTMKKKKKVET